jgi:hypothetical protein
VDFTVELDPKTLAYLILGYNVVGVEPYRKREDELEFKPWKSMTLVASNRADYQWTTAESDVGKYEFAALVNTKIVTPLLEITSKSSVKWTYDPVRNGGGAIYYKASGTFSLQIA